MVDLVHLFWTLFGPYAPGRTGPLGAGLERRINNLKRGRPLQTNQNQLEVLAGAIPWGFKSLSPHHINQ
jgi:hypothetical protein